MKNNNPYLLIAPAYPPPFIGGSKVWFFNMVENGFDANDHKVGFDILTSALKTDYDEVIGKRHKAFRSKYLYDSNNENPTNKDLFISYSSIVLWFLNRTRRVNYKAVIGGAFDFANGLLIILCKFKGIPIICLGAGEEFTLALHGKGLKKIIKRFWLKFTHPLADGFIVSCDFCKEVLVSIGVDSSTIFVVPSPVSKDKISIKNTNRVDGYNIISVGRIVERKGFHKLILATEAIKDDFPEVHTHIVGDGPYMPILKKLIKDKHLANYVTLHGRVSDNRLGELYQKSRLFVLAHMMLPNGDTEGCPTVFAEASGQGIPIIGGTGAGASTAISEGVTGFIVNSRNIKELSDRIKDILGDQGLAKTMGEEGIKKIEKDFTPEVTGKRFYNFIAEIIKNSYIKK